MALRINRVHLKILSIFLTLLIVCGGQPIDNLDCPTIVCRCFKISGLVNCSASENLIDIPKNLPEWAQKIELNDNSIEIIKNGDFKNLPHVKILHLMNNRIRTIEYGAFQDMTSLERLRLNKNRLRHLPDGLFAANLNLKRLDLSENSLTILTDEIMKGPTKLNNLQLDKNELRCLDGQWLKNQEEMEILTLNQNNLTTLSGGLFDAMLNLRTLRLADNRLHCDCNTLWLIDYMKKEQRFSQSVKCYSPPVLRNVALIDAALSSSSSTIFEKCKEEYSVDVKCSDFSLYNNDDHCPPECKCTESTMTVDCRDRGLIRVPAIFPEYTVELRLEQNSITFIAGKAFRNLKYLRRLDLSNNAIQDVAGEAFDGLHSLTSLILYGNKIVELPSQIFNGLKRLQLLLLNANRLQCLRRETFHDLPNLTLLSLYDNRIKSIGNGTFSSLGRLQTLHLAKNPIICDCNMLWLAEFLKRHPVETSGVRCESPKRVARKRFTSLEIHKFKCKGAAEELVTKYSGQCLIDTVCPDNCHCQDTVVDCGARNLHSIPKQLPSFTTHLLLNDNQIRALDSGVLEKLTNLRVVNLSRNRLTKIDHFSFKSTSKLEEIILSDNDLVDLDEKFFFGLDSLQRLDLSNNKIRCLNNNTFKYAPSLQNLNLANNRIISIMNGTLDALHQLQKLFLRGNNFICNCHATWIPKFTQRRKFLTIDNPVCDAPANLRGKMIHEWDTKKIFCYTANESACLADGKYCPAGCQCKVDRDGKSTVRCANQKLTDFPRGYSPPEDIEDLQLDNNDLDFIAVEDLNKMRNLKRLDLSYNKITFLENGTFENLTKLSTLILSYNKLRCLESGSFAGLHSLRILSLHGNLISSFPRNAFTDLKSISHIAVGNNALQCDCEMEWFSEWIKKDFLEPGVARCTGPEPLRGQLLLTTPSDQFKCSSTGDSSLPHRRAAASKCDACLAAPENPCENGGRCEAAASRNGAARRSFRCVCADGFYGETCRNVVDACYGQPCLNGGQCKLIEKGRFSCQCQKGFGGERCQQNLDDCQGHECKNGATCLDLVENYKCLCPANFSGWDCGQKVDFCSPNLNFCRNGATCQISGDFYKCSCAPGFQGPNCTENVDDCRQHLCQNGARCADKLNGYECRCKAGFAGRYCQYPTSMDNALYPKTSPCQQHDCKHGRCFQPPDSADDYVCRCDAGYSGSKCDHLSTLSFDGRSSYAAIEPLTFRPMVNLTLTFNSRRSYGVLLYVGGGGDEGDGHLGVELFEGRVRVSYFIGNKPVSLMFSALKVDDGQQHDLQLLSSGKNLTMILDGREPATVINEGTAEFMQISSGVSNRKVYTYLGGVPDDLHDQILKLYHLKDVSSLLGCIKQLYIDEKTFDFENASNNNKLLHKIQYGCRGDATLADDAAASPDADACLRHECVNGAECKPMVENGQSPTMTASSSDESVGVNKKKNYVCQCRNGFKGQFCQERAKKCVKRKFTEIHKQDGCRSKRPVKKAVCLGQCFELYNNNNNDKNLTALQREGKMCCKPVKSRKKRLTLHCGGGGGKKTKNVIFDVIRKCDCQVC